jgi:hypothetical protein
MHQKKSSNKSSRAKKSKRRKTKKKKTITARQSKSKKRKRTYINSELPEEYNHSPAVTINPVVETFTPIDIKTG